MFSSNYSTIVIINNLLEFQAIIENRYLLHVLRKETIALPRVDQLKRVHFVRYLIALRKHGTVYLKQIIAPETVNHINFQRSTVCV